MGKIVRNGIDYSGSVAFSEILNVFYPVGSYYWTSDASFSPSTTWGGTWIKLDEGVVLTSAGDNYPVASDILATAKDGGDTTSDTGNTTLAATNIPAHTHGEKSLSGSFDTRKMEGPYSLVYAPKNIVSLKDSTASITGIMNGSTTVARHTVTINATHTHTSVGGGTAHNHGSVSTMQPYKNAYCWHRTA